ncbi:MAG: Sapep family Mn(2+)-dependent dipeptidase [Eubacteriales bacterium]|nr:Sapep family Mn(2+)-dependent dipeptidase [Eubacteriales bacterium]
MEATFYDFIDRHFDEQLGALSRLIAFPSVSQGKPEPGMPLGRHIHNALEYTLELAREMGFSARSLDGYCGVIDYGEGDEMLMVMAHLDVVPVGSGWTSDPFTLTRRDGRLIGRGVMDDKGPALSALYALYAVKEAGIPLKRRVRIFLGCDEEMGWSCVNRYKQTEPEPTMAFTPDGQYPVIHSEKNIGQTTYTKRLSGSEVRISCGTAPNVIPGEAKAKLPFTPEPVQAKHQMLLSGKEGELLAVGRAGHASTPQDAQNALLALLDALKEQPLNAEDLATASSLAALLGFDQHGEAFGLDAADDSGRLTLSADMLTWNESEVSVTLDCRFPFCVTPERLLAAEDKMFAEIGFTRTWQKISKGHYINPKSKLVQTLLSVYSDATGKKAAPLSIGGGTYARSFENAVGFGVEPEGEPAQAHMPDESCPVESIRFDTRLIAEAIKRLAE